MQTSQSLGILFTTRPDKAKHGKEPIYACVTVNRQRTYTTLKQNVDPENWDGGKGAAKGNKDKLNPLTTIWKKLGLLLVIAIRNSKLKGKCYRPKLLKTFSK